MKNDTKAIIIVSLIVIGLLSYISYYSVKSFQSYQNKSSLTEKKNKKIEKKEETVKQEEPVITKKPKIYSPMLGTVVEVQINDTEKLPFVILEEDENTYTLISKDSLGYTTYYANDTCNTSNQNSCANISDKLITKFLKDKTKTWTNVGEIIIPTKEEINELLNLGKDNISFLTDYSFWLKDYDKDEAYYFNKDEVSILKDKVYLEHDLKVFIKVMKNYID